MYALFFLVSLMSCITVHGSGRGQLPAPSFGSVHGHSPFGTPSNALQQSNASAHNKQNKEQAEAAPSASAIHLDNLADLEVGGLGYQENDRLLADSASTPKNTCIAKAIKEQLGFACSDNYLSAQIAQLEHMNPQAYNDLVAHCAQSDQATRKRKTPKAPSSDLLVLMHKMVAGAAQTESNEHKKKAVEQEQLATGHAKRADRNQWLAVLSTLVTGAIGFYMNHQCSK
jgi:hypothetical protein